jgi:hypothetical protein
MKNHRLVVFIRHDSAEIWRFRYGLALGIGTLKIMASTGVFVRVICDLICSFSCDAKTSSTILTSINHKESRSYQKNDLIAQAGCTGLSFSFFWGLEIVKCIF